MNKETELAVDRVLYNYLMKCSPKIGKTITHSDLKHLKEELWVASTLISPMVFIPLHEKYNKSRERIIGFRITILTTYFDMDNSNNYIGLDLYIDLIEPFSFEEFNQAITNIFRKFEIYQDDLLKQSLSDGRFEESLRKTGATDEEIELTLTKVQEKIDSTAEQEFKRVMEDNKDLL